MSDKEAPRLAHNVYFTLKEPSPAKVERLVEACKEYLNLQPGIVFFAAGTRCEELDRDVNDTSWHVGLHIVFIDKEAHDNYQEDATHLKFIEEQKGEWADVRVFDSFV